MFRKTQQFWNELDRLSLPLSDYFNSKYFYDKLDELQNFSEYKGKCESLLTGTRGGNAIMNTCAKLLYYLKNNQISNKQNAKYDVCPLLNYWLYSKLNMILKFHDSDIKPTFAKFVIIWNDFILDVLKKTKNETCEPMSNIVAYEDWKKRKELYEYYVNYDALSDTVKTFPNKCEEFYQYVEGKKELYEYFKKLCTPKGTNRCPEFYDKCEKYDPDIVLPHPYCHNTILHERAPAWRSSLQRENSLSGSETDSDVTDGPMRPDDAPKFSGNPKTVENVGNILLGVVATTMTSGALYRFTPLGGMIRNGLGWNNNNMSNINGGDFRLYDYASEPFNPYPGEEHYIGYHPA
ncbi:Plasmodium vivax Vir protein, putative [Plasmodium vivax]|nr:Plasmodium vivax Vir protein, putative [Plasmodium vivax]